MYVTLWTLRVSPVYVYRYFSHGFVRVETLREPEKLQLYFAFGRSTTLISGKGCAWRRHVGKMCNFPVPAFDHANSWKGLLVSPKICHFTTRLVARQGESMVLKIDA